MPEVIEVLAFLAIALQTVKGCLVDVEVPTLLELMTAGAFLISWYLSE